MGTEPAEDPRPRSGLHPLALAAAAGALWGTAAFLVLWGHTPITVTRSFVVGSLGTAVLLPVRIVLWGLRAAERVAGRPFHFPDANWWIGMVAALVGAGLVAAAAVVVRAVGRRLRA